MEDKRIMKKISIAAVALALVASTISATPANAAPVSAAKASVLKECSTLGQVAKKKGADGSDLYCIKATKGGMKGKQVWQYKTLPVVKNLDVIVPNSLTSGFGGFGKAIADAMKAEGLTVAEPVLTSKPTPYSNSLKYVNEDMAGKAGKIAVTGFAQVGGAFTAKAGSLVSDGIPVARMYAEYSAIAVKADSKYKTIEELVADLKKDPKSMAIVGNAVGGVDYYVAAQLFEALGLSIKDMNYTANSTVAASILSDAKYAFAVSGYGDFPSYVQAGTLRLLAVTGPTPIKGVNVPTLVSKKINVVVQNWRGIVLPPKTSAAGRAIVIRALDIVNASKSYAAYLESQKAFYNWLPGASFDTWLKTEEKKIRKLYAEIGLL
jgi:putative tricarboxylic transport membrane protein